MVLLLTRAWLGWFSMGAIPLDWSFATLSMHALDRGGINEESDEFLLD